MQKTICRSVWLLTAIILLATGCGKEKEDKQAQSQTEQKTTEVTNNKSEKKEPEITITSDEQEIKIEAGETRVLSYAVTKSGANSALKFTSGDTGKVTVDERGNISGVTEGKTYVVAKCEDAEYYWNVTVLPAANISGGGNIELYVGDKKTLYFDVSGGDEDYVPIINSSDNSIVDLGEFEKYTKNSYEGIITASNVGNTTVIVEYGNSAKCEWNIIVHPDSYLPDGVYGCSGSYENVDLIISDTSLTTKEFNPVDVGHWNGTIKQNVVRTIEFSPDCFFGYYEGDEEAFKCDKEDILRGDGGAPCYYFTIKDNVIVSLISSP